MNWEAFHVTAMWAGLSLVTGIIVGKLLRALDREPACPTKLQVEVVCYGKCDWLCWPTYGDIASRIVTHGHTKQEAIYRMQQAWFKRYRTAIECIEVTA